MLLGLVLYRENSVQFLESSYTDILVNCKYSMYIAFNKYIDFFHKQTPQHTTHGQTLYLILIYLYNFQSVSDEDDDDDDANNFFHYGKHTFFTEKRFCVFQFISALFSF